LFFHLKQRLRSLGIISAGGFLMLVVFILEGIRFFLEKRFEGYIPDVSGFLNELVFFLVTAIWFSIAFRYIANAKPTWRPVFMASAVTALLFTIGKVVLRSLLLNSNIGAIYGASGAILLVMLFVFYSSFIFYYGACLVNAISEELRSPIPISGKAYKFRYEELS
ncbi:YihY/virulence factor BrkB family protein, partial [Pseudoxanthomonas sp. SGD-10]